MQRPAIEPRDEERALLAQRPVDVGGVEALAARADCQARAALVLPLDGEQALRDRDGTARPRPRQELCGETPSSGRAPRYATPSSCAVWSVSPSTWKRLI
jgi:hypothetical protein